MGTRPIVIKLLLGCPIAGQINRFSPCHPIFTIPGFGIKVHVDIQFAPDSITIKKAEWQISFRV
jgi:hypothetical protein